jgi:predicted TIM-barrel fold metal-dependent hydrolase
LLGHARQQALDRGLDEVLIVDADFHQMESDVWSEILAYLESEVLRDMLSAGRGGDYWLPGEFVGGGIQEVSGRIRPQTAWDESMPTKGGAVREIARIRETVEMMGVDYVSVFPTHFLTLGATAQFRHMEPALAQAYARWITERVLAEDPRIIAMLFLPFSDPEACLRLVEEFGDRQGVVGFMITTVRFEPSHGKGYMRLYRALEERGLPLGFHSGYNYHERSMEQFNKFLSVHALGFPYYAMAQATNWIVNGLPELFPKLKLLLIESGLAWVPFLMQRLDHSYMMRQSEAPLLKRLPSEYMREFYYTSQPMEAHDLGALQATLEMINAETQLLWASDWPHWDWDPPAKIWDLPFLDETVKRRILGENARSLFDLPRPSPAGVPNDGSALQTGQA